MKFKRTAAVLVIFGVAFILADIANLFPAAAGSYAIVGAILIGAGVLIRADN